jgi:DNA-binding MarR family transcriptional regulator
MPKKLRLDPIAEARRQWVAHGWDDAADGMATVTSVIRAHQLLMSRIDRALKPFDLSFARYEMLRLLAFTRAGMLPMSSAIARLQVHATSVTNTVERLARDGLVTRERHPSDGRAALLVLTDFGRATAEDATAALNDVFADLGLTPGDQGELVSILTRFRHSAGDFAYPL